MGSRALTVTQDAGQPPDEIGAEVAEGGLGERHLPEAVTRRGGAQGPSARPLRPRPWPGPRPRPRPRPRAASGAQLRAGGRAALARGAAAKPGAGPGLGRRRHPRPGRPEPQWRTTAGSALRERGAAVPSCAPRSSPCFRLRLPSLRRRAPAGRGLGRGPGPWAGAGWGLRDGGGARAGRACGAVGGRRSELRGLSGRWVGQVARRGPVAGRDRHTTCRHRRERCLHLRRPGTRLRRRTPPTRHRDPARGCSGRPGKRAALPRSPEWGLEARPCPRGPPSGVRGPGKGLRSRGGGSQGEVRGGARPSGPQSGRPWWRRKAMEMALELGRPVCPVCSHQPCMGGSVCGVFGRVDPAPPRATPGARPLSSSQTGWFLSGGAPSHHLSLGKPEGLASFPLDPDLVGDLKRPHPGPPGPFPAVKGPPPPHSQGRQ